MRNIFIAYLLIQASCQGLQKEQLEGLWQLEEVKVDGMISPPEVTFLRIDKNNCFAVSRTSGDMSGIYQLGATRIHFQGKDKKWFNTSWNVNRLDNHLVMKGVEYGFRVTELRFKKAERIPDYEEFEARMVGKWEMYLMMHEGIPEKVPSTWMTIDQEGGYVISDESGVLDHGRSIINTRHRKVIFEKDNTHWDIWFFGKELRLQNREMGVQYHMRKNG